MPLIGQRVVPHLHLGYYPMTNWGTTPKQMPATPRERKRSPRVIVSPQGEKGDVAGIVHDPVCVVKEVSISREVTDFSQPCRPGGRGRTRAPSAPATCLATRSIHLGKAAGGQQEPETRFTSGTTCRVWRGSAGRASPPGGRVFGAGQVKCDGPTPIGSMQPPRSTKAKIDKRQDASGK